MATIRLYLDTRCKRADGTYPIRLAFNHHSGTAFVSLNQYVKKDEWDKRVGRVRKRPDKDFINDYLLDRVSFYNRMLMKVLSDEDFHGNITATELRDRVLEAANPHDKKVSLFDMFERYKAKDMSKGTRNNYTYTWNSIERFTKNAKRIKVDDINREWLDQYDAFLASEGMKKNSRIARIRCLCAVFNYAIDNNLTKNYPFRKLNLGMSATAKRDLTIEEIRAIFFSEVDNDDEPFRDMFKLVFYLIGINAHDLYNLTPSSIIDGRLEYERLKTKKHYSIKLQPEAMEIIKKYNGDKKLLSFCERFRTYQSFFNTSSGSLHNLKDGLTLYYARHTWATLAFKLGISKDTISLALGHSFGNRVTSIYINEDLSAVDEANRKLIDWVLYDKK